MNTTLKIFTMSDNYRNSKKLKGIISFFKNENDESSIGVHCGFSSLGHSTCGRVIFQSLESHEFESQKRGSCSRSRI